MEKNLDVDAEVLQSKVCNLWSWIDGLAKVHDSRCSSPSVTEKAKKLYTKWKAIFDGEEVRVATTEKGPAHEGELGGDHVEAIHTPNLEDSQDTEVSSPPSESESDWKSGASSANQSFGLAECFDDSAQSEVPGLTSSAPESYTKTNSDAPLYLKQYVRQTYPQQHKKAQSGITNASFEVTRLRKIKKYSPLYLAIRRSMAGRKATSSDMTTPAIPSQSTASTPIFTVQATLPNWFFDRDTVIARAKKGMKKAEACIEIFEEVLDHVGQFTDTDPESEAELEDHLRILREHAYKCAAGLTELANFGQIPSVISLPPWIAKTPTLVFFKTSFAKRRRKARAARDLQVQQRAYEASLAIAKEDHPRQETIQKLEAALGDQESAQKNRGLMIGNLKKIQPHKKPRMPKPSPKPTKYDAEKKLQEGEQLAEAIRQRDETLKNKASPKVPMITEPVLVRNSIRTTSKEHKKREVKDYSHKMVAAFKEILAMKAEKTELKTEKTELKTEKTELKTEKTELKTEKTELKTEKTELKTEKTELKTEKKRLAEILEQRVKLFGEPEPEQLSREPKPARITTGPRPPFHPPPVMASSDGFPRLPPGRESSSAQKHKKAKSTLPYAAAAKKSVGDYVGTLKITRYPVKLEEEKEAQRPVTGGRVFTGAESAYHGNGKKGLENMLKKQTENYNKHE
ncbi:hypothetical protein K458DRAFT_394808 [Lentithecium fluviatile CBS 122367]|uniref:Uncharacterized protein n=1 Tax=Lentithecium fluviatile CBS 122367 TaxID=1168545 RepID=A0A6G1IKL7_9PLEO|nr:hypothetical protein K458DRAFT_394808 [Lentithecium fluviatile CBS 122367]